MRFSDWLIPLRRPTRRSQLPARHQRAAAVLETLEDRVMLSGVTGVDYHQVDADWFATYGSDDAATTAGPTQQWIVRLTDWMSQRTGDVAAAADLLACETDGFRVERGLGLPGQLLLSVDATQAEQVLDTLSDHPFVAYIEEDVSAAGAATFPNEQTDSIPLYSRQYGLDNTGQSGGNIDSDIDAPEAWDITTGSLETVIAVIDSGVDYTHSDLYLNLWINQAEIPPAINSLLNDIDADGLITFRDLNDESNVAHVSDLNATGYIDASDLLDDPRWADGIDTDGNDFEDDLVGWDFFENDNKPFDEHRHGTHVAGIIGATGNNGVGITGVNWQTSLMPLRFLNENNKGVISDAVEAINYTTMMRTREADPVNIRVSNNSWGSSGSFSPSLFDAVSGNLDADILLVAAAGNGNVLGKGIDNDTVPFFPASFELENVISVAALNDRGELAAFSNYGIHSVDIAAPGDNILSLGPSEGFISRSGTSMATPHVTGVAALVFDVYPTATAGEVREAILAGAETTSVLDVVGSRSLNAHGALTASTFAPVPELVPIADITSTGVAEVVVSVKYRGDNVVDLTSLDVRDIEVTRQGFSETLLTPFSATVSSIDDTDAAVYRIQAPGETWDASDNGSYMVFLREGEVRDVGNLYSVPRELGQFEVAIVDPNVFFVDTTDDTLDANPGDGQAKDSNGDTSLRSAVMEANSTGAASTIVVPDGIYTLTIAGQDEDAAATGDLDLASSGGVILIGGGAGSTVIDAQRLDRLFDVHDGVTAEIHGFTLQNGNADQGGGLKNTGTLTIGSSIVTTNTAETAGGGVHNEGLLTITGSSLENNRTSSRFFGLGGGGLTTIGNASDASAGQALLQNSSIVGNTSTEAGGGLFALDAGLTLTNVTVSANTAQRGDGGGVLLRSTFSSQLSVLTSVTITQNEASSSNGGGLAAVSDSALVTLSNSIVAGNRALVSFDVEGRIVSDGTNLFGQPSRTQTGWRTLAEDVADLDQIGTAQSPLDPGLRPLQRLAGAVQTRLPLANGLAANSDVAGRASLALTDGLPIVYSSAELEPNNSRGRAMSLDDRGWSRDIDSDIADADLVPHVTVTGTGDGTFDFYSFQVAEADSNATFDVDNGGIAPGSFFDTELFLFTSDGTLLASNDDSEIESGSSSGVDSRIEHQFVTPGRYVIAVGKSGSSDDGTGGLIGETPSPGDEYVLNVSVENHPLAVTVYNASPGSVLSPRDGVAVDDGYLFMARRGTELFNSPRYSDLGNKPTSVVLGDLNGDGVSDVVTANNVSNDVSVLIGNGDGSFRPAGSFGVGGQPQSVALGDVNSDGISDIVTANTLGNDVSVLIGIGDGTFQVAAAFVVGSQPQSVALGDMNGDGKSDIVTANRSSDDISVLIGNGNGTFQAASSYGVGETPQSVALADVNGDGANDLVTANLVGTVSVLIGNNDGTLQAAVSYGAGDVPASVALGDLNSDGVSDIVTANTSIDAVFLLIGNGDGTFQTALPFNAGDGPSSLALGDVNGDGVNDIVTGNSNNDDVSVLIGHGDGTFLAATNYAAGDEPRSVALGDMNGDGITDIVTANKSSNDLSVHLGDHPELLLLHQAGLSHLPHRGFPTLFIHGENRTYFVTTGDQEDEVLLWSMSSNPPSVRQEGSYFSLSTLDRPREMFWSEQRLVLLSELSYRDFDPGTGLFTTLVAADGTFPTAVKYGVGDAPESVALDDVNNDGVNDIVTANKFSNEVSVLMGNSDGTFDVATNFPTGDEPRSVVLGDVDGDGNGDIVTANRSSNDISVLFGNGDGTFQTAVNYSAGEKPRSVALGHLNTDGFIDIVTGNLTDDRVSILIGNGDGSFQAVVQLDTGDGPESIALGDVNSDGTSDIITANKFSNDVSVLTGNGDGTFQAAVSYASGQQPSSVAIGDVNGDGNSDIVTANRFIGFVHVLIGSEDGTFEAATGWPAGNAADLTLGDVNGDGVIDIVTANLVSDEVSILIGNGDGTFPSATTYNAGDGPASVALADVNGDGVTDIVTADFRDDKVGVFIGSLRVIAAVELDGRDYVANATGIQERSTDQTAFEFLELDDVESRDGVLRRTDYEFLNLHVFENQLLASVRLKSTTSRPGELELLLIGPPYEGAEDPPPKREMESLLRNTNVHLAATEDDLLTGTLDTLYLSAEIIGEGIGSELFAFTRRSGLRLVADLLPGPESSQPLDLFMDGDIAYFTALATRVDSNTGVRALRRELFVLDSTTGTVRAVRAGQEVDGAPSLIGSTLFFNSRFQSDTQDLLWSYETSQDGIPSSGASDPNSGTVSGTIYLDRDGDGQQDADESGRVGATVYADINGNQRREAIEPFVVSRSDDPATTEDEAGRYVFENLPAGTYQLREVPADGFRQTAPLTILSDDDPVLTELATVTTSGDDPDLGLPSIVGGDVVYVNLADSKLVIRESDGDTDVPLVTLGSVIPDEDLSIASIGASHAQDGNSIVLTATLTDDRELVLAVDSSGRLGVVAETGKPLTTVPPGGQSVSTTLTDIEGARNQGFDSLSIVESSVGFLAETADGRQGYFLGGATQARFAEFDHAQVLLDGNNESFVDRVVEETGTVLTGSDLFLDKASLDAREGVNTGWQITTRSGIEILPLTFFDRIIDVSISGLSAAFKASDAAGNEALYLSSADGDLTREVDTSTSIPAGSGQFTRFGSNSDDPVNPSVALDGENFLFIGARDHATSSPPISVAIGDVNGDEFSDIVTTHSEHISVLIGNGDGTFQVAVEYGTGTDPESVALNDFDGDGDNDIVTANFESGDVSVLLGNGDGTFLVAVNYLVGDGPRDVAVGDVNGDGDSDIVTANRIGNNVSVLLGNGDGTFQAAEHQSTGEKPRSVALGDSYGNGVVDIITASLEEDTISVLRRNGDGTFEVAVNYNVGDGPRSVTVGDMDGDGDSDIVTANKFSNNVSVLKGNGDGTFEAAVSYDAGSSPFSVDLGDVDGDGSIDIVTANRSSDDVSILIGNGDATFQDAVSHRMGDKPLSVVLGDVTNNGLNDIVTANAGTSNVSVFVATGNGAFRHSPEQFGLYAKINGAIQKVVDRNSDFGARQLSDLAISHQALSGNQFVFHATFSDGTESLYHAELLAEPFVEVTVRPGRGVDNVGFGASALPGTIQGVSFTDTNVDGEFDPGESRNTGRTVFLDENLNGLLDESERKTLIDEMGEFAFVDLPAEATYVVREVLPGSLAATTLRTLTEATLFLGAARTISVDLGSVDQSALGESADGVVQGLVFTDTNANRVQDDATTEPGRADVTVFADENGDGVLNGGERSTVTASDGTFTLDQLTGIRQSIRIVFSSATEQTVPLGNLFTTSTLRTLDSPVQVVSGDFDGDGIDDIASTINQANEVRFFLNDGTGDFNFGDRVEVASGPGSIDVGKFSGPDGREGLVVGHRTASSVKVLVPHQDGSFGTLDLITPQDVQAGGVFEGLGHVPYFVTTGDFNGDQQDDIAVAAQNAAADGGAVSVFLSNGDGTFTHEQTVTLPKDKADAPSAITAGRANPGTTLDLVVANLVSANVVILSNSGVAGSGRFEIEDLSLPVGGVSPSSVQLGDLDNDGHNEIVTTNLLSNDVSIFTNNGDGTFETATQHSAGTGPAFAQLVDLDQNGSLDIAFSNSEARNRFGILRNRDDGTFLAAETSGLAAFPDGTLAFSLAIGQFDDNNDDGVIDDLDTPDVVVSNRSDESLTGAVGSLTVGLNQIVPGALRVDLPPGARSASGLNFGLRTLNLPPTVGEIDDPMAINEDDPEQTVTVEEITTGGETESLLVTVSSDNTPLINPTIVFDESSGTATLRYTPTENLSGTALLSVTVRDPGPNGIFDVDAPDSDDGLAARQFSVTVNAIDDPPPAVDDLFNVVSGLGSTDLDVLSNDEAENPDADEVISVLFVHPAANGTVDILDERTLRYTPDADFVGTETLTYTVTDTRGIAQAEVTVNTFAVTSVELEVGNDALEIDVVENLVRVRRNGVVDDTLGNVFSGSVDSITLTAGDGDNLIDLSGVTSGDFTLGTGITVSINAGAGQDTIIGSGLPDSIDGGDGDDTIVAGNGDDTINGGAGDDKLNGGGGNDTAHGGDGNDSIDGGGGEDVLSGGDGDDRLRGQGSEDTLSGGDGNDTLDGGPAYDQVTETADVDFTITDTSLTGVGDDVIIDVEEVHLTGGPNPNRFDGTAFDGRVIVNAKGGDDTILGGVRADKLQGGAGRDLIEGGDGDDVVRGQGGSFDTVLGQAGNDRIDGGIGNDHLEGGDGDDKLTGGSGNDVIIGGAGIDKVQEFGDFDMTLTDTLLTTSDGDTNTLSEIETGFLKAGNGNNTLLSIDFSGSVTLVGLGGDDTLTSGSADDNLAGRAGDDVLSSGDGNDTVLGQRGNDSVTGGAGNDSLVTHAGDDTIDAGTGDDTVFGGGDDDQLQSADGANMLSGGTGNDSVIGGIGNDELVGGTGDDTLWGRAGDDSLAGGDGSDDLHGEEGADRLEAGTGADTVDGGEGTDMLVHADTGDVTVTNTSVVGSETVTMTDVEEIDLSGDETANFLDARSYDGMVTLRGGDGNDTLAGGSGGDHLLGENGDDILAGFLGDDVFNGGSGNDSLLGGDGNDTLGGGGGQDAVVGELGDDMVKGQGGADTLAGGSGGGQKDDGDIMPDAAPGEIDEAFALDFDELIGQTG